MSRAAPTKTQSAPRAIVDAAHAVPTFEPPVVDAPPAEVPTVDQAVAQPRSRDVPKRRRAGEVEPERQRVSREALSGLVDDPSQLPDTGSADEFLSALADAEIDRMLAEDDDDAVLADAVTDDVPQLPAPFAEVATLEAAEVASVDLEQLLSNESDAEPGLATTGDGERASDTSDLTAAAIPALAEPLRDQLDRMFEEVVTVSPLDAEPSDVEVSPAEADVAAIVEPTEMADAKAMSKAESSAAAVTKSADQDASVDQNSSADEDASVAEAIARELDAEVSSGAPAAESTGDLETVLKATDGPAREARTRWQFRLPGWIDGVLTPLENLPPRMRDLVGAVAILTLLNALAIIGFVLIWGPLQ